MGADAEVGSTGSDALLPLVPPGVPVVSDGVVVGVRDLVVVSGGVVVEDGREGVVGVVVRVGAGDGVLLRAGCWTCCPVPDVVLVLPVVVGDGGRT